MYNYYKTIANSIIPSLSSEQIEAIYRYQQMLYRKEDVIYHAEDMCTRLEITEDEMDFVCDNSEEIAELYLYKYSDCNLAENDVFEELIRNYISDKYNTPNNNEED